MKRKIAMILSMALVFTSVPVNSITGFAEEILIEEPGNESAIAEEAEVWKETEDLRPEETEIWQETESVETPEKLAESESMDSVDMTESSDSEQENIDSDMILGDVSEDESEWVTGETSETFSDLEEVETESETESTVNEEIEILNIEEVNYSATETTAAEKQISYMDIEWITDNTYFAGKSIDDPACFLHGIILSGEYEDESSFDVRLSELSKDQYTFALADNAGKIVEYDTPALSGRYSLSISYHGYEESTSVNFLNKSHITQNKLMIEGKHHEFQPSNMPDYAAFQPSEDGYCIFTSTGQIEKFSVVSDKFGQLPVQRIDNFRRGVWLTAGDVIGIELDAKSEDGTEDSVRLSVVKSCAVESLSFSFAERIARGWKDLYNTPLSVVYTDKSEETILDFEVNWKGSYVDAHATTKNGMVILLELYDENGTVISSGTLFPQKTYRLRAYLEGKPEIYAEQTITISAERIPLSEGQPCLIPTQIGDTGYFEFLPQETADYCISVRDSAKELHAKLNLFKRENNNKTLIQSEDIYFYIGNC